MRVGPYTVDALWRPERVIVELDGGDGHASYAQMVRDRGRDLYLRRVGHSVPRSWRQVTRDRRAVAADVRRALRARPPGWVHRGGGAPPGVVPPRKQARGAFMPQQFRRGNRVEWNFRGRRVVGRVRKRLTSRTEVAGQVVAASKDDPRYLVRTERTGRETARRPSALTRL